MNGEVAPGLAVTLRMRVRGDGDATIEVTGIVATGFTGYLTLPSHLITLLGLTYHADIEAQMGDGRVVTMRLFRAGVV
jgi:predicted aspartyl protease